MKYVTFFFMLFMISAPSFSQKYKGFKYYVQKNEYGRPILHVEPNHIDGYAPEDTKQWGLYGMRLCYTVNGKQKAARQDITNKIVNLKKYTFQLSFVSDASVSIDDIQFFSLLSDESNWPKKEDCF